MKVEFETMSEISIYERPEIDILTLDDTQSAFYLFILTTMASIIVAILECIIAKVRTKISRQWHVDDEGRVENIAVRARREEESRKENLPAIEVN